VTKTKLCSPAVAVLILGCAACGDSQENTPGGSTDGIDTSTARVRAISHAICQEVQRCNPAIFAMYAGLDECVSRRVAALPLAGLSGEDVQRCQDAALDLGACLTQLSCTTAKEQEEVCGDFHGRSKALCAEVVIDGENSDASLQSQHSASISPARRVRGHPDSGR
jgi:hypothetical protein